MSIKIAIAGNPNCGKTTLFNLLTGSNQYVGNWPGVTVEKKEGNLKGREDVIITDLPGIYSLSPYTLEEVVARDYLLGEKPDAILNIVDGTNIERNLYLTTQLTEIGIPVVIAINMMDIVRKRGDYLNAEQLGAELGCGVVEISALKGTGIEKAVELAIEAAKKGRNVPKHNFAGCVEHALAHIEEAAVHGMDEDRQRWYAVKIFERDKKVIDELSLDSDTLNHIERDIKRVENELDDDAESIIANERYVYIGGVVSRCYRRKNKDGFTASEKIDKIVTNRFLALPIFALIMWFVYYISIGSIGDFTVGFMNDTVFGRWIVPGVANGLIAIDCAPWLISLVADGIVGGVGAVLGFVPQMLILFLLLSLLEDCGYMARATVVLDPIFKKVGLSGKSVIPFVIGTGCAIPGVMACRTIRNERERRATAMLAPFMPCGAKLPVIALFAGAFFSDAPWVGTLMYFLGIAIIFFCALLVNLITGNRKKQSYFIIELPEYKVPSFKKAFFSMCRRGWSYIVKAGTIILVCNFVVQLMQSFGWNFQPVESASESILASIAGPFAYVIAPMVGVVAWQLAAAAITGFIAKENVVGTLAVCFVGLENLIDTEELALIAGAGGEVASVFAITKVAALAYLMFNLFSPPCFAAIGAMNSEMKSKKWLWSGIALQFGVGYTIAFLTFFFGTIITGGSFGAAWMPIVGWCVVAIETVIVSLLVIRRNKQLKAEAAEKRAQTTKETVNV